MKRFSIIPPLVITPLKRGVNESASGGGGSPNLIPPVSLSEKLLRLAALGLALLCLAATRLRACGPTFPNNLLDLGDNAVLLAPVADFERELDRMKLAPARFHAVPVPREKSFSDQTGDAEMGDLRAALRKARVRGEESEKICMAHQAEREKLKKFLEEPDSSAEQPSAQPEESTRLKFQKIEITPGLPAEFADYFAGALAWHNPVVTNENIAREAWERLLARPAVERKFKSTWAAFMLGKSWDGIEPTKAVKHFRRVRELAGSGFADSLGLAAASFGLEARAYYQGRNYAEAIKLYLDQLATGDSTAIASLQQVAVSALGDPDGLRDLATNALARQVITAYVISSRNLNWDNNGDALAPTNGITGSWLSAVEAAGVEDVESAEKLALAAYQAGAYDMAQRWIARSSHAAVAQWIQAKLLLRAGKTERAAALLAIVTKRLPVVADAAPNGKPDFADDLFMKFYRSDDEDVPARRQVLGELGVLRLSRGEFTQALDALLRAGFWMDAAYVAERVLSVEELKDYVDRNWPQAAPVTSRDGLAAGGRTPRPREETTEPLADEPSALQAPDEILDHPALAPPGEDIRYLLARRLTRELHGDLARAYYPAAWQTNFDALVRALIAGWDETQPAGQRAASLFEAAGIARTNGMELLGTEVQPDWHVHGGNYQDGVTWEVRSANSRHAAINVATAGEIRRASRHTTDPERRFHYRYQAAFLAWEAAKLMPNHDEDTAFVLWTAGGWLKDRDPETADIFYKALVRRCRKTALGAEADRIRWFPPLDEDGNVIERDPSPKVLRSAETNLLTLAPADDSAPREEPDGDVFERGYEYTVHSGDTLTAIVEGYRALGVEVSVQDVVRANAGLHPPKLVVGQKIFIPAEPPRDADEAHSPSN